MDDRKESHRENVLEKKQQKKKKKKKKKTHTHTHRKKVIGKKVTNIKYRNLSLKKAIVNLGGYQFLRMNVPELGALMRTEFLCISVFRVASGPRVKLASCKSALNPPPPPAPTPTVAFFFFFFFFLLAVVLVLFLLFVALSFFFFFFFFFFFLYVL